MIKLKFVKKIGNQESYDIIQSTLDNEYIVGCLLISVDKLSSNIDDFFIFRDDRNNGYGKEALRNLLYLFRETGIIKINLQVGKDNNIAIKLYEKFGFEIKIINPLVGFTKKQFHYMELILN